MKISAYLELDKVRVLRIVGNLEKANMIKRVISGSKKTCLISKGLQEEDDGKIIGVFERKRIQTGIRNNDYIQIINADDFLNSEIVTSGAFYLKAEMNKGEGDDD